MLMGVADLRTAKVKEEQGRDKAPGSTEIEDRRPCFCSYGPIAKVEYPLSPFFCAICASPAITLPSKIEDHSPIRCRGCNAILGTWGELKERALRSASGPRAQKHVSCDPLPSRER